MQIYWLIYVTLDSNIKQAFIFNRQRSLRCNFDRYKYIDEVEMNYKPSN